MVRLLIAIALTGSTLSVSWLLSTCLSIRAESGDGLIAESSPVAVYAVVAKSAAKQNTTDTTWAVPRHNEDGITHVDIHRNRQAVRTIAVVRTTAHATK